MAVKEHRARAAHVIGTALLHTPWLRRLGRISFLDTLDAHPRIRNPSSRLEHSLGVAALGVDVAEALELSDADARVFVAACLLHDVGHFPLSHAAEPAFKRAVGADHHDMTRWVILGEEAIEGPRSLRPVLERQRIDPAAVWALIDGEGGADPRLTHLLRARINLDTLEGIVRVASNFRVRKGKLPQRIFGWKDGLLCIEAEAVRAIDDFWALKDRVYDEVINLPSNILAEARLCELVAREIGDGIFARFELFDDAALAKALGQRFDEIQLRGGEDQDYELRARGGRGEVLVRTRKRYFVDRRVGEGTALEASRWGERYQHEKVRSFLISRNRQLELPGVDVASPVFEAPEI
jgi:HD superfamily phosphohydrolase